MFGDLGSILGGIAALWAALLTYWKIRDDKRKAAVEAGRQEQQKLLGEHERSISGMKTKMLGMQKAHSEAVGKLTEKLEEANRRIERLVIQNAELRGTINAYSLCPSEACPYRNGHGHMIPDEYSPKPLE